MKTRNMWNIGSIVLSVCLGCLAPYLASAQLIVTRQPSSRFLAPGQSASFSLGLKGSSPFTYQWFFDETVLPGATNATLVVTNAQPAFNGDYFVVVSNASGSVTSAVARLKCCVPAPHDFSSIEVRSDRSASLSFKGETTALFGRYYDLYPLETSPNLIDWTPLAVLERTNAALDTLRFLDTNAPSFGQRFYRLATNLLVTPLPRPTGPYAVGVFSMLLTDTSRTNKVLHTNQQFMITFWYPTVAQSGGLLASFAEKQVADYYNLPIVFGAGGNFATQAAAFSSHSHSNAPLATNLVKYPVVLYSPGYQGHRRENTDKVEDLASWGYVVVGLDHRDTYRSVFLDGKVVAGQPGDSSTTKGLVAIIEDRVRDEQFVLDQLVALNANDPRLAGRLNLNNIGAFGWSIGGATTAQLCLRDPRCKVGANFDGSYFETNLLTQALSVPYLFFCMDDSPAAEGPPNDDRWPVFNHLVSDAYWVKLTSTVHCSYSDLDLIVDSASLEQFCGTPTKAVPSSSESQPDRPNLSIVLLQQVLERGGRPLVGRAFGGLPRSHTISQEVN